jgi:transcriptional regulator with XRE-family HTH domain
MARAGRLIKKARIEKRLTQQELARLCEVSQPLIAQLERDQRPMYPKIAAKLKKYLGVEL